MSMESDEAKTFIAELVARSRVAQRQIEHYSQEQVDALIRAMVWAVARPGIAEEIAQFTIDETQLGNYDGKFLKILHLLCTFSHQWYILLTLCQGCFWHFLDTNYQ